MGQLIRAFDWTNTLIGPPECWSPTLRATVSLMLANRFPLLLWWGPQYVSIYNDAYVPILGAKHPKALGQPVRECWSEIWHILKPMIDTPFQGGTPTWIEDLMLEVNRHGYLEEGHWTVAYSPVPDETMPSGIGGVLATVHEITEKVVADRRINVLRDLAARATESKTVESACMIAAETLSRHAKDIPFALLYVIDDESKHARLAGQAGFAEKNDISPATIDLSIETSQQPWPLATVLRTESLYVLDGLENQWNEVPRGPWSDAPRQAVIVPIRSNLAHRPAGMLVAGVSPRLKLDERYTEFYEFVGGQIATAIANARAYEEERKRAEALAELDRSKTTFFSNVSHELRTPLTLMLGPLEELKAQYGHSTSSLSGSDYEQVDVVHRNGLRLLKLVNTLLDFSRIEAGRAQAVFEETDLATFTADLASVFRSTIEKAGLSLIVDCLPTSEPVFVDRDMWEKIVLNLLSNAFKFTFVGEIEVTLRLSERQVELSIRDTGTGIPEDQLGKIFERFHRIAGSQGRTHEGTGIGLSLVQELVRLHGGSVSVESVYGQGSTFRVCIPLGKDHLPHPHIGVTRERLSTALGAMPFVEEIAHWLPHTSEELGAASEESVERADVSRQHSSLTPHTSLTPRARVLLADDNADMREYVSRLLKGRYDIVAVADGQVALDAVRRNPPDLILTDVMMPRMDGFALVRALRADPATKTIPVILLSARAGEESRIEGLEQGADDYLIKPFSARELLARIEMHLKMTRVRQEAQTALRESEARFRAFTHATSDVVYRMSPDWAEMRLLQGREFIADTIEPSQTWLTKYIHPEDQQQVMETIQQAIQCKKVFELEHRVIKVDGSIGWTYSRAIPILDHRGAIVEWFGTASDVTPRKLAEEALTQARERFDIVRDGAQVGFWFCDLPFDKLVWDNRVKEHFWLSADAKVTIETFYERLHPDDRESTRRAIEQSIATNTRYDIEYRTIAADHRQEKWIRAIGQAYYDDQGRPTRFDGVTLDITERKRAEESLRLLNNELEQRVADRTRALVQSQERLRAMATELNLAEQRERKRLATELHDHLQQMLVLGKLKLGQGQRLAALVPAAARVMRETDEVLSDALRYTRTLVTELSPSVLRDHGLPAGLKWLGEYMQKHDLSVTVTVPDGELILPENQVVLLFQSVRELLINASKHAGIRQADVMLERNDEFLRIEVRDQGVGFDVAAAATATGTSSEELSSKFGLFSIQERMRALGGSFELASALGKGTTAILMLPLRSRAKETEQSAESSGIEKKTVSSEHEGLNRTAPIRILLVDDHPMMRQGLRSIVTAYDHFDVVGEAGDGVEAVELAQRLAPDVVVMDINMPKMDGIEATRWIKSHRPTTMVIGLSVNQSADTEYKMKVAGACTYLTKESAVEALCQAIEHAMRGASSPKRFES